MVALLLACSVKGFASFKPLYFYPYGSILYHRDNDLFLFLIAYLDALIAYGYSVIIELSSLLHDINLKSSGI